MFELLEPSTLLFLGAIAFSAGFIDAIAGGGGMLTIPALLSVGLPPHTVLATNKLAATFGSSTAAFTYYRRRLFSPSFWKNAFIATLSGAIIGTFVVDYISSAWLEKILPVIILAVAVYTIWHPVPASDNNELPKDIDKLTLKQTMQGIILGYYDGIAGPGTGAFWVVSNMSIYKINILLASGVAKAMNFTSNIASLATFIVLGHVNWAIGLLMGVCLMTGSYLGARSAIRFGAKFIRPVFICVVSVLAAELAYNAWIIN